ncbi:MAG: DNA methyltransferase [Actinomycetota bacterium]
MSEIVDPQVWCSDAAHLLRRLRPGVVDLVYFDPPYGVTQAGWDVELDLDELLAAVVHATHERSAVVVHSQGMFTAKLMTAWATAAGRKFWRYNLVWEKVGAVRGFLNAGRMPLRQHEDICVFYRRQPTYNPQFTYGHPPLHSRGRRKRRTAHTDDVYGDFTDVDVDPETATRRHPTSILRFAPPKFARFAVQKPIPLSKWIIETYTDPGDVVCDPTMGSGTALIAGAELGRLVIGGDLHSEQVGLTRSRLAEELYADTQLGLDGLAA